MERNTAARSVLVAGKRGASVSPAAPFAVPPAESASQKVRRRERRRPVSGCLGRAACAGIGLECGWILLQFAALLARDKGLSLSLLTGGAR